MLLLVVQNQNGYIHVTKTGTHLTIRFLPAILGVATTISWRAVNRTFGRITPYISMARAYKGDRFEGKGFLSRYFQQKSIMRTLGAPYFPYIPFFWLKSRHFLLLLQVASTVFLTSLVSFKSVLFTTTPSPDGIGLHIQVSTRIAWILVFTYLFISCLTFTRLCRLFRCTTGLRWDPDTIADQMALLHNYDMAYDFCGYEFLSRKALMEQLRESSFSNHLNRPLEYRLGYWKKGPDFLPWYGIARMPEIAVATHGFQPHSEDELEIYQGQLVNVLRKGHGARIQDWWLVKTGTSIGYVPCTHLLVLENQSVLELARRYSSARSSHRDTQASASGTSNDPGVTGDLTLTASSQRTRDLSEQSSRPSQPSSRPDSAGTDTEEVQQITVTNDVEIANNRRISKSFGTSKSDYREVSLINAN